MAILFDDGATEYLRRNAAPAIAAPFTMAAWCRSNDPAKNQIVMAIGDKDVTSQWWAIELEGETDDNFVRFMVVATSNVQPGTSAGYSADTWHHVCAVEASSTSHTIFIEGGSKGTSATDLSPANADAVTIGCDVDTSRSRYFSGDIAHAAVWNIAFTDAEVAALAAGWPPWMFHPNQLAAYWPLNSLGFLKDVRSTYNMTAYNTPVTSTDHPPILHPGTGIWTPPPLAAVAGGNPWNYYAQVG